MAGFVMSLPFFKKTLVMATPVTTLVKDTAWYGLSTIVGRLLNWLLVPFYVRVLQTTGEYGIVTNLYAWTALLLVVLTYGMETGFFRFANQSNNPKQVYRTALHSLATTSLLFALLVTVFAKPISVLLLGNSMPGVVIMMAFIIASDAFMAIPYAYLRLKKRAARFATIKLVFVAVNIGFNLFFLLLCPYLYSINPSIVTWCYRPSLGVEYIFLSNLLANAVTLLLLFPAISEARGTTSSFKLLRDMLAYSIPLVVLGIAGIFNQMADKILFPFLYTSREVAMSELGIYGACFKIAVIMVLFTQAFRYAFEPFFFEKSHNDNDEVQKRRNLALVTNYFWLFMLMVFLAVMAGLDILKHFVVPEYYRGLAIVPWVMWGEMMMGIALNLSTWYKLTNHTGLGAIISAIGCFVGVILIVLGVPRFGFMACAWAIAISNTLIVVISYFLGQKHYPIPYNLRNAFMYLVLATCCYMVIYFSNMYALPLKGWHWVINIIAVVAFVVLALLHEKPLRNVLKRVIHKFSS